MLKREASIFDLMSEIQDSLDQLLHAVKNAEFTEKIHVYYVIEPKNSGRLKHISNEETILHIAARHEQVDIAFETGSDMTVVENSNKTPIILEKKPYEFLEAIDNLLKTSTTPSIFLGEQGRYYKPTLPDFFEYVLKIFLDIILWECENNAQRTAEKLISLCYPLFQVVSLGNCEVIEHMLLRGCPVNERHPTEKFTALSKSVRLMDLEMVKLLIKYGANVGLGDKHGLLPIAQYTTGYNRDRQQHPEIIKILLNNTIFLKDSTHQYLARQLREAFRCGNKEVIQMLLECHDYILKVRDVEHKTPLHYLSENRHSDITELLKGREIDVNVRDYTNCTPLFMAAHSPHSHVNTFKFLLENGANVNARNNFEYLAVPLFALCYNSYDVEKKKRYFEIIELFLKYDVDIQYVGSNETTVFDIIVENHSFYVSKPLLAHLAVLEEQGKPITELICKKISSNQIFKNYYDFCKSELVKMKNNVINEKFTLYTILFREVNEKQILKSCRFSSSAIAKFEELKKEFKFGNCYYTTVQKRVSSIIAMLELLQKAAPVMSQLLQLGNNPCHIIVNEIINYLDAQDLQTLIKVKV